MSPRGCLVIIFNHPYPANVGKLKQIYSGRFARVVFLMPLEQMNDADIFTVYRGSYTFHGSVADARQLLSTIDADFFVFAADDLLINPYFDERELYERLHIDRFDGWIPGFFSFSGQLGADIAMPVSGWPWTERVLSRLYGPKSALFGSGCEAEWRHLPRVEEALSRFAAYGMSSLVSPAAALPSNPALQFAHRARNAIKARLCGISGMALYQQDLPYPMAGALSDFFVVRSDALMKFSQYCGVFAALDIFVEVAVPTALVLGCEELGTVADTSLHFKWTYTANGAARFSFQTAVDYPTICREFDDTLLFLHPVKFSQVAM